MSDGTAAGHGAALAGILSERSGVISAAIEGQFPLGAFAASTAAGPLLLTRKAVPGANSQGAARGNIRGNIQIVSSVLSW